MKKNGQRLLLFVLSVAVCLLLASCQENMVIPEDAGTNSPDASSQAASNAESSPATDDAANTPSGKTTVSEHLSTGPTSIPIDEEAGARVYEYDGGEVSFEASILAEGTYYNNLGFMLYLNGAAVPFVMEGVDGDEAAYFHILRDVSDQGKRLYQYRCVPYGGTAGEEAIINVLCFAMPEYVYDPGTARAPDYYITAHWIATSYGFIVRFNESAPGTVEMPELETMPLITNVTITEDSDQQGFIEELNATYYKNSLPKMTLKGCLDWGVQYIDYYDGVYDAAGQVCIDGKDTVHMKYRFLGMPGSEVTLAFAIGKTFVPVLMDGADNCGFTLEEGKVYTVEADIDVSGVTEATNLRLNVFRDGLPDIKSRTATFYFTA